MVNYFTPCIYIILILPVCVSLYRLGLWRSYRLETDVIRTSMTWRGAAGKKIYLKVINSGIIIEKSYATNAFLWEEFIEKILNKHKNLYQQKE